MVVKARFFKCCMVAGCKRFLRSELNFTVCGDGVAGCCVMASARRTAVGGNGCDRRRQPQYAVAQAVDGT